MRENKQKRVCDEYNTIDFLEGGNRRSSTSVGLTWEANRGAGCMCRPDKSVLIKPITIILAREGWQVWQEKLDQLDALPSQILIGMEATSRYGENL
jgi:hypothetical protein